MHLRSRRGTLPTIGSPQSQTLPACLPPTDQPPVPLPHPGQTPTPDLEPQACTCTHTSPYNVFSVRSTSVMTLPSALRQQQPVFPP